MMKLKVIAGALFGFSFIGTPALSSDGMQTTGDWEAPTIEQVLGGSKDEKDKKKKKMLRPSPSVAVAMYDLDEQIIKKFKGPLRELIGGFEDEDNKHFQERLKQIRKNAYSHYEANLASFGQANRTDEQKRSHFSKIWKDAINDIYEEEKSGLAAEKDDAIDEFSDEVFSKTSVSDQQHTFKTTLLNILMRRKNIKDLAFKIQTLIENGADKNLHKEFSVSPKMQNQSEYPLKIALDEIDNPNLRLDILKILLDDNVMYTYNKYLDKTVTEPLLPIKASLENESNKDYVLDQLLEKNDFPTFDIVLSYLEKANIFIIKPYQDKISQIEDQIYCPILEKILDTMRHIRLRAISTDKDGVRTDNIKELFASRFLEGHLRQDNHDSRFGLGFRQRLKHDFRSIFESIAKQIDSYRNETEIHGQELQDLVIEWVMWANFRNRVASHLNKFALSASNNAEKANVIRLIRYTNIYNKSSFGTDDDEIFRELHELGGKDIIFMRRNKYGWTPLMYAMAQKQSEGIQLYLRQATHEITLTDGIDNNILHLAFPLPEEFFQDENKDMDRNVLQLVGAQVGRKGVKEKTEEAIKAIITERSVDKKDKIKALKQLSASNFTPVSLAAAMGYVDIYEYLKDYLKGEEEWNRDDHAYLDIHIEELVVKGLKNYLEVKKDALSPQEIEKIHQEIAVRQKEIDQILKYSISEIYHPESAKSCQFLDLIMNPAKKILDDYEDQKGTKRAKAPYVMAFDAAINEMLHPSQVKVDITETRKVEKIVSKRIAAEPKNDKPKKKRALPMKIAFEGYKGVKRSAKVIKRIILNEAPEEQGPKFVTAYDTIYYDEPVQRSEYQPSPLRGMVTAHSIVKASYLAQVVREITSRYLRHHTSPKLLDFNVVYKGLTENEMKDFFQQRFNATVEKKMQEIIKDILHRADRLREDDADDNTPKTRFDNISKNAGPSTDFGVFQQQPQVENDSSDDESDDDSGNDDII